MAKKEADDPKKDPKNEPKKDPKNDSKDKPAQDKDNVINDPTLKKYDTNNKTFAKNAEKEADANDKILKDKLDNGEITKDEYDKYSNANHTFAKNAKKEAEDNHETLLKKDNKTD